jgi:methylenetetrahydrofolate dehydrogenase (NADP+)/methenyltetrahydrofolate cyclohydrolase
VRPIDGRAHAAALAGEVGERAAALRTAGVAPTLGVVVPTGDEATAWYVRSLARACGRVGVEFREYPVPDPTRPRCRTSSARSAPTRRCTG